jgi:hypothetical protein
MKKKIKRKTYRLWIQIEKHVEFEGGGEKYYDINDRYGVAFPLTSEMECTAKEAIKIAEEIENSVFPDKP